MSGFLDPNQAPGPFVFVLLHPARGTGLLKYCLGDGTPVDDFTMSLQGRPWNTTGRQPFVWDFVPPAAERTYAVLRVAADPSVTIRHGPRSYVPGPGQPDIEIIRVQDSRLLPQDGRPLEPHRLVRAPFYWQEGIDPDDGPEPIVTVLGAEIPPPGNVATVVPKPNGLEIRHVHGVWEVHVVVPLFSRAAFAYQLYPRQATDHFVRIVHTPNLEERQGGPADGPGIYVLLEREPSIYQVFAEMASRDAVPPQGSSLERQHFRAFQHETHSLRGTIGLAVLEADVGSIPYIGVLYDLGQLIYSMKTGRNYWTRESVSRTELGVMGLLALLPAAISAVGAARRLRALARGDGVWRRLIGIVVDERVAGHVAARTEPELVEAVRGLTAAEQESLVEGVDALANGRTTARQLLARFDQAVERAYLQAIASRRVERILDITGFRNPILAEGYSRYVSRGGVAKAFEWARLTRSRICRRELLRELGPDFVLILRRAENAPEARQVSPEALRLFDELAGEVTHYRDLRRRSAGIGHLFEADHFLEQRFMDSASVADDVFDPADIFALLVPKDEVVAAQLPGYRGYAHSAKTGVMRQLIPHGAEDVYTLQQWWDAHVYAFESLAVPEALWKPRLTEMFEDLRGVSDSGSSSAAVCRRSTSCRRDGDPEREDRAGERDELRAPSERGSEADESVVQPLSFKVHGWQYLIQVWRGPPAARSPGAARLAQTRPYVRRLPQLACRPLPSPRRSSRCSPSSPTRFRGGRLPLRAQVGRLPRDRVSRRRGGASSRAATCKPLDRYFPELHDGTAQRACPTAAWWTARSSSRRLMASTSTRCSCACIPAASRVAKLAKETPACVRRVRPAGRGRPRSAHPPQRERRARLEQLLAKAEPPHPSHAR